MTTTDVETMLTRASRMRGCLLGGALGDALGYPIEFHKLPRIRAEYGPAGVTRPAGNLVSDDTQMTLFTAEALLRAYNRLWGRGFSAVEDVLWHAYLRWLSTQGRVVSGYSGEPGWLVHEEWLHAQRAPGNTCLAALEGGKPGERGEGKRPLNDSKGCGTVMRVAPCGFLRWHGLTERDIYDIAANSSALTHGHRAASGAAGAMALLVHHLLDGVPLADAVGRVVSFLRTDAPDGEGDEVAPLLEKAMSAAEDGEPSGEKVEALGGGWVAEEALAIAVYCTAVGTSVESALLLAVNHGGDSDSTGAIAGNLLGALHGEAALPAEWLEKLEGLATIRTVADDLVRAFDRPEAEWDHVVEGRRYPPD